MDEKTRALYFALFNEICIIGQLSRALLEARLPDGMLISHFSVLNHLIRVGEGSTPLQIARAFQVPKTTMTHTLSVLERDGLVRLSANPNDGRSKCVWLTDRGREFRDSAIAGMAPDFEALAAAFPPDGLAELVPRLTEIRKYLDGARNGTGRP